MWLCRPTKARSRLMSKTHVASLFFALAFQLSGAVQAIETNAGSAQRFQPLILALKLNSVAVDSGVILMQDAAGMLYMPAAFFIQTNLRSVDLASVEIEGVEHFALSNKNGLSYKWDRRNAELSLLAKPSAFVATQINIGSGAAARVAPYVPGAFLNYDLSLLQSPGIHTNQGLIDIGVFAGEGLVMSSFTLGDERNARLMTTFQTDRIDELKTLRIGDSFNSTGAWGRGVLFGGFQYGTNFSIRPDFVTMAMPSISGNAVLPSTVDVYVNHALRTQQQVNAGPFSIQNLPVLTGPGEVQVVVKDLLGREQLITQSFFVTPDLLREGLVEDVYEFGWLRQNYGQASNDYSDPFATLNYRKGLSEKTTGEWRLELQKDVVTSGLSGVHSLPSISSVVESSVAIDAAKGLPTGALGSVSYGYLGQRWSANARMQYSNISFRQIGTDPLNLPQQIGTAQVSAPLIAGVLSINYLRRQNYGDVLVRVINLNYSQRMAQDVFATFTLLKTLSTDEAVMAGLTLTVLFDQTHIGSASLNGQAGKASLYAEYQKTAPRSEGFGYRLAAKLGGESVRQEASISSNRSAARLQADITRMNSNVSTRLGALGGVNLLDGDIYFSRGLAESFAIVSTQDLPDVPIYLENQLVMRTNKQGRAVVSNLRPYQKNRIRIDPLSLPIDASVNEVEKVVSPRSHGGVLVAFDVRRVRNATLKIVMPDGSPLPAWTPVEVVGVERSFISGKRGEVSVELSERKQNLVVARPVGGAVCEATFELPSTVLIVPTIGPLQCSPRN